MRELASSPVNSRLPRWPRVVAMSALGALLGGLTGAALVIGFTELLKGMLAVVVQPAHLGSHRRASARPGALGSGALRARSDGGATPAGARRQASPPRPRLGARVANLSARRRALGHHRRHRDLRRRGRALSVAPGADSRPGHHRHGRSRRARWGPRRLRRTSESRVGAALGDRGRGWRRLLRPAAVAGGAAGVSALMGIPLVGTAYILEMGPQRRTSAPLSAERVTAALVGGVVGWLMNVALGVDLIRLVVPKEPPHSLASGGDHGVAHRGARRLDHLDHRGGDLSSEGVESPPRRPARARRPGPGRRRVDPGEARRPAGRRGTGRRRPSRWVESTQPAVLTVLAVALLRAVATTARRRGRRVRRPVRAVSGGR